MAKSNFIPDTVKPKRVEYKPIDQVATIISDTQSIVQHGKVTITPEASQPKIEKKPVPLRDVNTVTAKEIESADTNTPPDQVTPKEIIKPKEEPIAKTETPKEEIIAIAPKPEPVKRKDMNKKPVETTQVEHKETATASHTGGKEIVYFTVQLLAAKHKPGNYDDLVNTFGLMNREEIADGVVRYMAGEYPNFTEAKKALELAHSKGITDAFIVGYLNRQRLDGKATYQLGLKYP